MKSNRWWRCGLALAIVSILLPTTGCVLDSQVAQLMLNVVLPLVLQAATGSTGTTTTP